MTRGQEDDAALVNRATSQCARRIAVAHRGGVSLALLLLAASIVRADDWPRWRGPGGDGVAVGDEHPAPWPADGPQVLWRAQVGTGFSSLTVADGRLYTLGNADEVDTFWCLDAATGDEVWHFSYPQPLDPNLFEGGPTSTPTVHAGQVLAFSRRGLAICRDAATGDPIWQKDVASECDVNVPQWGFSSSPVVHKGLVLLNAGSAGVALSLATGAVVWKSDNTDDAAYATPVIAELRGETVALILSGKALHAVDPLTGTEQWNYRWLTRYGVNAADPLVRSARVLLTSGYSKGATLLEIGPDGPMEVWRSRELRNQMSPGVRVGETVFAVDGDAGGDCVLKAVDFETGTIHWTAEGLGSASLVAVGETLVILSESGELVLAPATSTGFAPITRGSILTGKCWTSPAYAHGVLFARNAAGEVVAVQLAAE